MKKVIYILTELIYNNNLEIDKFLYNDEDGRINHLAAKSPEYGYIFVMIYGIEFIKDYKDRYNISINININKTYCSHLFILLKILNSYKNYNKSGLFNYSINKSNIYKSNIHRIPQLLNLLTEDHTFFNKVLTDNDIIVYDIYKPDADLNIVFDRLKFLKKNAALYYNVAKNKYMKILKNYSEMNENNANIYSEKIGLL